MVLPYLAQKVGETLFDLAKQNYKNYKLANETYVGQQERSLKAYMAAHYKKPVHAGTMSPAVLDNPPASLTGNGKSKKIIRL